MSARPFLFGEDFGRPARSPEAETPSAEAHRAALEEVERRCFALGVAEGRRQAEAETARRLAETSGQLLAALASALGNVDRQAGAIEDEAVAFFRILAARLAGGALAAQPLAAVAEAGREAFRHLRGVPHLAARVHETLVDDVDALLRGLAREAGYDGRVIVIADDEIAPGDARLDWADGGVVRERRALEDAVSAALARTLPLPAPTDEPEPRIP